MSIRTKRGFCKSCNRAVLGQSNRLSVLGHLMHLFLTIGTFGIWALIWVLHIWAIRSYRCPECGDRVRT